VTLDCHVTFRHCLYNLSWKFIDHAEIDVVAYTALTKWKSKFQTCLFIGYLKFCMLCTEKE